MDDNVFKIPRIEECRLESGYDKVKGKTWIQITFPGYKPINEYFEVGETNVETRVIMSRVVQRCLQRLAVMMAAEKRKEHAL